MQATSHLHNLTSKKKEGFLAGVGPYAVFQSVQLRLNPTLLYSSLNWRVRDIVSPNGVMELIKSIKN